MNEDKNIILDDKYKDIFRIENYEDLKKYYNEQFQENAENIKLEIDFKPLIFDISKKMVNELLYLDDILNLVYRNFLNSSQIIYLQKQTHAARLLIDQSLINLVRAIELYQTKDKQNPEMLKEIHSKILKGLPENFDEIKDIHKNLFGTEFDGFEKKYYDEMYDHFVKNKGNVEEFPFVYMVFIDVATLLMRPMVMLKSAFENSFNMQMIKFFIQQEQLLSTAENSLFPNQKAEKMH